MSLRPLARSDSHVALLMGDASPTAGLWPRSSAATAPESLLDLNEEDALELASSVPGPWQVDPLSPAPGHPRGANSRPLSGGLGRPPPSYETATSEGAGARNEGAGPRIEAEKRPQAGHSHGPRASPSVPEQRVAPSWPLEKGRIWGIFERVKTSYEAASQLRVLSQSALAAQRRGDAHEALLVYQSIEAAAARYGFELETFIFSAYRPEQDALCEALLRTDNGELVKFLVDTRPLYEDFVAQGRGYQAAVPKPDAFVPWFNAIGASGRAAILAGEDAVARSRLIILYAVQKKMCRFDKYSTIYVKRLSLFIDSTPSTAFAMAESCQTPQTLALLLALDRCSAAEWLDAVSGETSVSSQRMDLRIIDYAARNSLGSLLAPIWSFKETPGSSFDIAAELIKGIEDETRRAGYLDFVNHILTPGRTGGRRFTSLILNREVEPLLSRDFVQWVSSAMD